MMGAMRTLSVEELGRLFASLPGKPRVVVPGNAAVPWVGVRALDASNATYTLHALNAPAGIPDREGVTAETCFVGPGMRRHPRPVVRPEPALAGARAAAASARRPTSSSLHCAPPRDGQLSLGIEVNVLPAAIEACRSAAVGSWPSVNDRMPYTYGDAAGPRRGRRPRRRGLRAAADARARRRPTTTAGRIGERVADRVADGATLQAGIGAVPDATLAALTGRRGLRVWTEMFSDGVLALDRVGALDPRPPAHRVVPVRLAGALRLGRRQPRGSG